MNYIWNKKGEKSVEDAFGVRMRVFVHEQGYSADIELDDIDNIALHLTGYDENGVPVCAARLFEEHNNIYHAGRIAVEMNYRGRGLGREIMRCLIEKAKTLSAKKIVLGAQYDKVEFYEKCGFKRDGREFLDEGYPHVGMQISL